MICSSAQAVQLLPDIDHCKLSNSLACSHDAFSSKGGLTSNNTIQDILLWPIFGK